MNREEKDIDLEVKISKNKMTKAIYMEDCYLKEFEAEITDIFKADFIAIALNQTAFYPTGGGVPCDTGKLIIDDKEYKVDEVYKRDNKIWHVIEGNEINESFIGKKAKGIIDWERRYKLMRYHTAAHLVSALIYKDFNALITGNQINLDYARIDFNLEKFDKETLISTIKKANELIKEGREVKIYFLEREKALQIPGIVKLASKLPPDVERLRIVEISGIDIQADGGCHVKNISEIGELEFIKAENKGKANRRVYFRIKE